MTAAEIPLIATTAFGLEAIVKRELLALGYEGHVVGPGRIEFTGGHEAICRSNLWLRTADRVLVRVARFPASDFEALFEGTKALSWDRWIPADGRFPVVGRSIRSQLSSVPACQRAVKRAIVDQLFSAHGVTELPETTGDFKVEIALLDDVATLTIDTTGPSLHKRAYRQSAAIAPLKETLAAALVTLSFWRAERPLLDPFCGSGTIPIEAAMIGRNIAPGSLRSFASESWPNITTQVWQAAREEARDLVREPFEERLVGTDIDKRVLQYARANAERAGVADLIHFQDRDFRDLSSKRQYGCVITNPPYGERMGDHREHAPLYGSMPEVLRRLPTWSHFVFTSYPGFEQLVQLKADRRRKLYNGRIECTYFQFHGPRPDGRPSVADEAEESDVGATDAPEKHVLAAESTEPSLAPSPRSPRQKRDIQPVFGGLSDKAHEQAELFRRRLTKRARHFRRWPSKQDIHCFRLYERDVPEIPLVVDRLEDHLHITEYERPHDRDRAQHADWLDLMCRAAGEALDVAKTKIVIKRRQRQRGSLQHDRLSDVGHELEVREGGLRFVLNLSDYVDTGLFLDHRITRSMVRDEVLKRRFLNLFAYTGSFTVYAADGAASHTTTVDTSRTYLNWAKRNLALNRLDGVQHEFVRNEARQYLRETPETVKFDVVVADAPTFSNRKGEENDWTVQDHHVELLQLIGTHLDGGGIVYFSTNFRRFKLDEAALVEYSIREISAQTVPPDFRNRRIHRCWRMCKVE
ncbi:MAG TPA: bifunctional 23S rRNA (guanine(2069)-N(7))-methyltransferase RlmK/23S rRNA (guanine(2445)-N(2))-methyltransferase RlmL [Planctomycetes bacterium]|nr:bifunctional 23S rRNA (guanine(2069)-N(7))-methyltransferase RlmK/23S rRNA (guanine(2445)-N(2))-methyltransferase RlmL [Planctomycetota bacterium]